MAELKVFSGSANEPLARDICEQLGMNLGNAMVTKFKNGETRVKIMEHVRGTDVFVIQPTSSPTDHHLMELLIMIDALVRASASSITAVIPYYGYAKQEKKTSGREPITAKLVANLITVAGANRVVAIDLHAPAIQGFFDIPVDNLSAIPLLADRISESEDPHNIVVVSPDSGGVARAEEFRTRVGAGLAIIAKKRPEPDVVEKLGLVGEVEGKVAVIVDDMISTGGTLAEAASLLLEHGARKVVAYAVHPVLAADAIDIIRESCLEEVIVTNTILVPPEARDGKITVCNVAPLLAEAIRRIHEGRSVSALFQPTRVRQELLI